MSAQGGSFLDMKLPAQIRQCALFSFDSFLAYGLGQRLFVVKNAYGQSSPLLPFGQFAIGLFFKALTLRWFAQRQAPAPFQNRATVFPCQLLVVLGHRVPSKIAVLMPTVVVAETTTTAIRGRRFHRAAGDLPGHR